MLKREKTAGGRCYHSFVRWILGELKKRKEKGSQKPRKGKALGNC